MCTMMFKKRKLIENNRCVGIMVLLLIGGLAFLIIGGLFSMWIMSMLPEIGIGILYIAVAIAIVIGIANISKAMLNKTLPKTKRRT